MRTALHAGWTLTAVGGEIPEHVMGVRIPATVPGCVHLDLLRAGLIPDPYLDENETAVQWVGRVDWRYETTLEWADALTGNVDLVAEGLDTVATLELNGEIIARTANMHRSYRFPISRSLRHGANVLAVTFAAGITAAERASDELGPRPHVNTYPFNALRKMACNFGWDWGPSLVTAGIWRSLSIESWSDARIASVRPLVDVDGDTGKLRAHVEVERATNFSDPLNVHLTIGSINAGAKLGPGECVTVVEVDVPEVQLWWPHGYGDQPLYGVTVSLSGTSSPVTEWSGRVGFRTVALHTEDDAEGTSFTLAVNGQPVFVRGVNWIPDDCFPSRITRAQYAERLAQAREANVNLVRVWGGGIYESEDFYDICDELGLLVWQDFLFACAAYSEEEPLRGEVVAEARGAVTRLCKHPSLALWNGNNENIWGHEDWGWKAELGDRSWGWGYYTELLPAIVRELDPTRPYSPGSPFSFAAGKHPNDPAHGTMHIWDVWNELDYSAYGQYVPRFVSEFGFQGPATWSTLTRAVRDVPLTSDGPAMLLHQKAEDGNAKLARGLAPHLPQPSSVEDWHWATSLNQARAVAFGIEHFRSHSPVCMGAIVWQLNDTWPAVSWAAVDSDGRRKPLWYALRSSFRDRLLTIQPRGRGLALIAVNDSATPWRETVEVSRRLHDGSVLANTTVLLDVGSRQSSLTPLPQSIADADADASGFIVALADGQRAWWHFREDIAAELPPARLDAALEPTDDGYTLAISAAAFIRDLALLVDRVAPDATVDEMLVNVLPGETVTFRIRTKASLALEQLLDPLVLRSANQLVAMVRAED